MNANSQVIIFDTTLRDGELTLGVNLTAQQKVQLAQVLEELGVDVIEVGYPGQFDKDIEAVQKVARCCDRSIICALAGPNKDEIIAAAEALKQAPRARLHLYNPVYFPKPSAAKQAQVLAAIAEMVSLARNYCPEVEWSAFDAVRSDADFLCQAVETAIASGATTISIPDTLGTTTPTEFSQLLQMLRDRVTHLNTVVVSVHCHNDLGLAVANSLAALEVGARQIECSINGLGARKGNADLAEVVAGLSTLDCYQTNIERSRLSTASKLVSELTGIPTSALPNT